MLRAASSMLARNCVRELSHGTPSGPSLNRAWSWRPGGWLLLQLSPPGSRVQVREAGSPPRGKGATRECGTRRCRRRGTAESVAGAGLPGEPGLQDGYLLAGTRVLPGALQDGHVGVNLARSAMVSGDGTGADHDVPGDAGQVMTVSCVVILTDLHVGPASLSPEQLLRLAIAKSSY